MVRQRSAKPPSRVRVSAPPLFSVACARLAAAAAVAVCVVAVVVAASASPQEQQQQQQIGVEVWPPDWLTDMPAVELTGTWLFDPDTSDPMIDAWASSEIRYEINQQGAFIVLDFRVKDSESNTQSYRWDATIQRFERGGRQVEEAARWTDAGRMLEIVGRHWSAETPEERIEYRFTYTARNNVLTFVQENESGTTVWRFARQR